MIENLQTIKAERDDYKARFEELKIKQDIAAIIETLPSRYDRSRVKAMVDDSLEVFMLDKDERVVTRSRRPAREWIQAKADLYNFTVIPASKQSEDQDYRFTGGVNLVDPDLRGKLS